MFIMALISSCSATGSMNNNAPERSLAPPPAATVFGEAVPVTAHKDHRFLLESNDPQLRTNKRLAYDLWRTVLNAGQVEAAERFLAPDYIQHNPTAPTGLEAFKQI